MRTHLISLSVFVTFLILNACSKPVTYIVYDQSSAAQEQIAGELASYLSDSYDGKFEAHADVLGGKRNIVLQLGQVAPLENKEAFRILANENMLTIEGNSDRALIHGAYAFLKKTGWRFYLSFEVAPLDPAPLDFENFTAGDAPLKDTRIVFNWHNFISGCTGWDLDDWKIWIDQSRKIGYNTIMVHAYGNNPMQPMSMNGIEKPVGYLTTSKKGRDWGAEHVNDVRRMIGGELYLSAEFGSEAAMVAEERRSEAAVGLMQKVFSHAAEKTMNVCYAIDVDTWMANPQEIMNSLPPEAQISIAGHVVANPDHPEGSKYYKEQLGRLLGDYPEITHLAAWMRRPPLNDGPRHSTLWLRINSSQLPKDWKREYDEIISKHPQLEDRMPYPAYFAMSKIIQCYRGILDDIKPEIELMLGSWELTYPPIADLFIPKYCGFIPLDYSYVLDRKDILEGLASAGEDRKIYPVVWAHHDDGRYIGRPYKSFEGFNSLLDAANANGYGVIHWTTHPLDLLFENYERQVWTSTENQTRKTDVEEFTRTLLQKEEENLLKYFKIWFSEGPMLGRETTDHFIATYEPYELDDYESALDAKEKAEERLKLLNSVDQAALNTQGKKEFQYQLDMEHFIISFFNNHHHIHQAYLALQEGNYELAREHAAQTNPEEAIRIYAKTITAYGATKGELGVLVSLNLRWLPEYINIKELTGLEDIRINFQPTSHDPLAQSSGRYSFHIDSEGEMWKGIGQKEIGMEVSNGSLEEVSEISDNWISIEKSAKIPLTSLRNRSLRPGQYKLEIYLGENATEGSFKLELLEEGGQALSIPFEAEGSIFAIQFEQGQKALSLKIDVEKGPIHLAGIKISPH